MEIDVYNSNHPTLVPLSDDALAAHKTRTRSSKGIEDYYTSLQHANDFLNENEMCLLQLPSALPVMSSATPNCKSST